MKYVEGLLNERLSRWLGKEWYHQRFDGSPYFMHLIAEAEITAEKRKLGTNNIVHFCFYSDGKADWYILIDDIKKIYSKLIEESKKDPKLSKHLMDAWLKDDQMFYKKCRKIAKLDLKKLDDKGLINLHDEFTEIALKRNSSSSTIDGFALGTDVLIAEEIKKLYDKKKPAMRFTEVFSILTAPVHLSFINEAELELLKLAKETYNQPDCKYKLLKEHKKKYFWIHNNYITANYLTEDYFDQEIDQIKKAKIDIDSEIKKISGTPAENKRKKDLLKKELCVDEYLDSLLVISEDFTRWQDERKKATFWSTHHFSLILEEICGRIKIPIHLIKYISPREVSLVFEKKPTIAELKEREKACAYYWDKDGFDVVSGKDSDLVKAKLLGEVKIDDIDDFRGLTACLGKVIGKAKVVKSVKEAGKVEKGDVLVAVMTRPDYISAMKKASAIVTDEGGVTCHAAIVARELSIPCIIGTKIATKVLKDGQLIEVNANHGWVKIIKAQG